MKRPSVHAAMSTSRSSRCGRASLYTLRISSSLRPVEENHCAGAGTGMIACIASGIAQMKRRHSSAQVPMSMSTFAALPAATSSAAVFVTRDAVDDGEEHHRHVEVVTEQPPALEHRQLRAHLDEPLDGNRRRASQSPGSTSSSSSTRVRDAGRGLRPHVVAARPRSGGSPAKSPFALGVPMSVPTLMPPADSPKIVTLLGSPPNAAMLSRTHSRARDLVEDAEVAGALRALEQLVEVQEPERVEAIVDRRRARRRRARRRCRRRSASIRCHR